MIRAFPHVDPTQWSTAQYSERRQSQSLPAQTLRTDGLQGIAFNQRLPSESDEMGMGAVGNRSDRRSGWHGEGER
jgi:hypothetical protein